LKGTKSKKKKKPKKEAMHLAKEIEPARLAQNNQTQSNVKLYPTV